MSRDKALALLDSLSDVIISLARRYEYVPSGPFKVPDEVYNRSIAVANNIRNVVVEFKQRGALSHDALPKSVTTAFLQGVDDTYKRLRGNRSSMVIDPKPDEMLSASFMMINTPEIMVEMYRKMPIPTYVFNDGFGWVTSNVQQIEDAGLSINDCMLWVLHLSYIVGSCRAERALGALDAMI